MGHFRQDDRRTRQCCGCVSTVKAIQFSGTFFQIMQEEAIRKRFDLILATTKLIFEYDPQLIFSDTFERINQQLVQIEDIISQIIDDENSYWISYNIVISTLPIAERLVFAGYSDQIIQWLLSVNSKIATNLMFCTSRFVPFRLQIIITICFAMANRAEASEKDAESLIKYFRSELENMKSLEEGNINGLSESIVCCDNKSYVLGELYQTSFGILDLLCAHFSVTDEIEYERGANSSRKGKRKGQRPAKDEPQSHVIAIPTIRTVELIINSFNSPISKADYLSKYGPIVQAWANPECQLGPALLYRLLFSFMKSGKFDGTEQLLAVMPEDKVIQLVAALSQEKWMEASELLEGIPNDQISVDFQFFNEIALKIWKRFIAGQIQDPLVLRGVLHVLCVSPASCPMQTALAALHYSWQLESLKEFRKGASAAERAISVVETFRDTFAVRKLQTPLPPSTLIPNQPLDKNYLAFEKWLECLYVDLYTVWIRCTLNYSLEDDIKMAEKQFQEDLETTRKQRLHEEQLYGMLDAKQRNKFDHLLNKPFVPPTHPKEMEERLLEKFKNNHCVKALIYVQMAFFRPKHAAVLLEKARVAIKELNDLDMSVTSPVIYANRHEIALMFRNSLPGAKRVAVFGKETVGSTGITLSNTALLGTGVKQDLIEPFVISKLTPNAMYTFAFGGFDENNELVDNLLEPFSVVACHGMSHEMIWSYIASAAYRMKDYKSFDPAMTYLLQRFTDVKDVPATHNFHKNTNPFGRFVLKPTTLSEPAPMLRTFCSVLLMAARIFSSQPIHATSFQKIALTVSKVLGTQPLTLTICQEMFAVLHPLLSHSFHSKWTVQPLLFILSTLNNNKQTASQPEHLELVARTSYALNQMFVSLYQEKQLSQFTVSSVLQTSANEHRTAFLLQAAKQQVLESSTGDSTMPLVAADIFRTTPEKAYDDLSNKFKADPMFPAMAVYMVSCAQNAGLNTQGNTWSVQALEHLKTVLHEHDEKPQKKAAPKGKAAQARRPSTKASGKSAQKAADQVEPEESMEEQASAARIQATWRRYRKRTANIAKFDSINKYRAALNMYQGMCLIEMDSAAMTSIVSDQVVGTGRRQGKVKSRHGKDKKGGATSVAVEEEQAVPEQAVAVMTAMKRAIVIGERSRDNETVKSAASLLTVYLSTGKPGSALYSTIAPVMCCSTDVLISYLPLEEVWAQKLIEQCLIVMLNENQLNSVVQLMEKLVSRSNKYADLMWMTSECESISETLRAAEEEVHKRDPAHNVYHAADAILNRVSPDNSHLFPSEAAAEDEMLLKTVGELAISLQHKQRLSMAVSLLTKMAYVLFSRNKQALAVQKLCEALECHFRLVKAHEKVRQLLENETEEAFYKKHSWSGCVSIFVIASLIAKYSQPGVAKELVHLASFALGSIFAGSSVNPKKAIDFVDLEPAEIIPGVNIFADADENQLLLDAPPANVVTSAFMTLISQLNSFDMQFEMFKPLAVAKHFFRFIIRDKKFLCRARIMSVIACCTFGLLEPAVRVFGSIISNHGQSRMTRENVTQLSGAKEMQFDASLPPNSPGNIDCIKNLASSSVASSVQQYYGMSIAMQYVLAVTRICEVFAESCDATGSSSDMQSKSTGRTSGSQGRKHRKSHSSKSKDDPASVAITASASTASIYESILKLADSLLNEWLSKEVRPEQKFIRLELMLERSQVYMKQWRWKSVINTAKDVLMGMDGSSPELSCTDMPLLTDSGIISNASKLISRAAFNLHDFAVVERYASPYHKALLYIKKADYENALQELMSVVSSKPVARFSFEYALAVGQMVSLICNNKKFVELWQQKYKNTGVDEFIREFNKETMKFFVEQLGMQESRSYYIRHTFVLVRLMHLESMVVLNVNRSPAALSEAITEIESAETFMRNWCPYVSHSVLFHLTISALRLKVRRFLLLNPNVVQHWNREASSLVSYSYDEVEQMVIALTNIITESPDLLVTPGADQAVMDLAFLTGLMQTEPAQKLDQSYAILALASSVRSVRRVIQAMIASCPDTTPLNGFSTLVLNDNPDQSIRSIAAAYYAHVCSLSQPIFDSELLDMRSLLFYKSYEDHLDVLKLRPKNQAALEPGTVIGQWYEIDTKIAAKPSGNQIQDGGTSILGRSMRSSVAGSASRFSAFTKSTTSSQSRGRNSIAGVRGLVAFFLGLVVEQKDKAQPSATPFILASQTNELRELCTEMAEVGVRVEEGMRMMGGDGETDSLSAKDAGQDAKSKKKGGKAKSSINLLQNQAEMEMKQAELQWTVTLSKTESMINRSNKIILSIMKIAGQRWPSEIKMNGLDMNAAFMVSHFLNSEFGINEKAPQLSDWLIKSCIPGLPTTQQK